MMNAEQMKKLITAISTGTLFLATAPMAFAGNGGNVDPCAGVQSGFNALCELDGSDLGPMVGAIVTFLLIVAVLIALFFLILGGIRWITSGGDKGKVESARNTIIAAIIGLVIAFLAFFILQVALGFFGLSLNNLELPTITGGTN
jgi:hypothetical protein